MGQLSDNSELQKLKKKYEEEYKQVQNTEIQRKRISDKYEPVEIFYLEGSDYTNKSLEELISSYFPTARFEDAYSYIKGPRLLVSLEEKYHELFEIWRFAMGFDTIGLYGYMSLLLSTDKGTLNELLSRLATAANKLYPDELAKSRTKDFFIKFIKNEEKK